MTSAPEIEDIVNRQRLLFRTGKTKNHDFRKSQLLTLKRMVGENEAAVTNALKSDLNKSGEEAFMTEVNEVIREINYAIRNLKSWMKPEKVSTPLLLQPGKSMIRPEPLGVALIVGPWNYPFVLVLSPLVGAIASGNCAVLKPSEIAPETSKVLAGLIPRYFSSDYIAVVEGGVDETTELLKQKFDHIFFTGGETVGKIVMKAAAEHLTPVTLELGGKSPCIVDASVDIKIAARRIAWGKFINAGQTCVAPDYLMVHKKIKNQLLAEIQENIVRFFGSDPETSNSFGRIINEAHFKRVAGLIETADVLFGGVTRPETQYVSPTVIDNVSPEDAVMSQEIFGPVLPVLTFEDVGDAIRFVNERPKPLALYVFSSDETFQEAVVDKTSSGGVCINDTIIHITSHNLPFGGVGASGMGRYHGKASFDTFSHRKSILKKGWKFDQILRYPPFKPVLKHILKVV